MKTRCSTHWLGSVAGGLLLAVPGLAWAEIPWGAGGIPAAHEECEADLSACLEEPSTVFPGDGYTGAELSYSQPDPPDGTFIDNNTGLMWEIKVGDPDASNVGCYSHVIIPAQCIDDPHNVNNLYEWSAYSVNNPPSEDPDGTAYTVFLAELNQSGFAGFSDWRIPTAKELQTLVDYSEYDPAVLKTGDGFPGKVSACDVCYHWSSTPSARGGAAWYVNLRYGYVSLGPKASINNVRAVRGPD